MTAKLGLLVLNVGNLLTFQTPGYTETRWKCPGGVLTGWTDSIRFAEVLSSVTGRRKSCNRNVEVASRISLIEAACKASVPEKNGPVSWWTEEIADYT